MCFEQVKDLVSIRGMSSVLALWVKYKSSTRDMSRVCRSMGRMPSNWLICILTHQICVKIGIIL